MNAAELDEKLILRIADGDGNAFKTLYQQTASTVYGFALSILKNSHDAEDIMHDAFVKIYTGAVTYRPKGKPLAWILTIVRNLCYNKIRSGRISEDVDRYEELIHYEENDSIDRIVLKQAMEILNPEERQIVILHAMTGFKHREIAEILDIPTGTVLSKYNRALRKMRDNIERKGEPR